jgi:hypothetical protein
MFAGRTGPTTVETLRVNGFSAISASVASKSDGSCSIQNDL